jgi:hypothetical protein
MLDWCLRKGVAGPGDAVNGDAAIFTDNEPAQ